MYDAGITVTVNSDDPPMFGTTLNTEYEIAAELLDLDESGIVRLAQNAVQASYMSAPEKASLIAEIDAYRG
jgi:aminodeoxyfutalosine deaminase